MTFCFVIWLSVAWCIERASDFAHDSGSESTFSGGGFSFWDTKHSVGLAVIPVDYTYIWGMYTENFQDVDAIIGGKSEWTEVDFVAKEEAQTHT